MGVGSDEGVLIEVFNNYKLFDYLLFTTYQTVTICVQVCNEIKAN
jgi:hypothetical protein